MKEKLTEIKDAAVEKFNNNKTKIKVGLGVLGGAIATAVAGLAIYKGLGDADDYIEVVGETIDNGVIDDVTDIVTEVTEEVTQ